MVQGSTETTFYVLAVYFGSVGILRARHAVACALVADAAGVLAAIGVCATGSSVERRAFEPATALSGQAGPGLARPRLTRPDLTRPDPPASIHQQDLHAIGAAAVTIEIALGQDDPVAALHQVALAQFVDGRVAQVGGLVVGRREGIV